MSEKRAKQIRRIERTVESIQETQRTFEECLARVEYEQTCQDNARAKAGRDRQLHRELEAQHAVRHWQTVAYAAIIAAIMVLIVAITAVQDAKATEPPANELMVSSSETMTHPNDIAKNTPVFVTTLDQIMVSDKVNSKIYNVPLDADLQQLLWLWEACEESGIDMSLALAVIWEETDYRNIIGDDGASFGYMQVQKKWHEDRMAKLGVTDLMDPASNFRVGCDYLAELLGKYPLANALAFYNSGDPTLRPYCERVMNYMESLESDRV